MKQVASVRDFFEGVATRGNEPLLSHLVGTWELDVEGAGTWKIAVDRGSLSVTEGPGTPDSSEPTARISSVKPSSFGWFGAKDTRTSSPRSFGVG
ncbi:MAG: hypothetical protein HOV80_13765 [Polyangiaceae bacterium]|nr:hypothetical protein [Polyangiaceae bacterium]